MARFGGLGHVIDVEVVAVELALTEVGVGCEWTGFHQDLMVSNVTFREHVARINRVELVVIIDHDLRLIARSADITFCCSETKYPARRAVDLAGSGHGGAPEGGVCSGSERRSLYGVMRSAARLRHRSARRDAGSTHIGGETRRRHREFLDAIES